jgi:tetratricopeptide (TPR) repeat protein
VRRNRFEGPYKTKSNGFRPKVCGRVIVIAAIIVALIAVAALVFWSIWKPDDKAIETGSVRPSPVSESSTAAQEPREEASQPQAQAPQLLFARNIEIDSVKAEAVEVALQLTRDLSGPQSIALLGDVYRNNGNSSEALKCWERSLELDPNNAVALNGMAWVAMQKAEYEKAAGLWEKAIRIDPNLEGVHGALAGALVCLGRPEKAIESFKKDVRVSRRPARSLVMMGNQHMLLKEYEKAISAFEASIIREPNNVNAHYGLANAHARTGQAEISEEYMNKFRELKVKEMEALKRIDAAFDDLRAVCRQVSKSHTAIGSLYMMHNRPAETEQLLLRAAQLDAENTTSRMVLASLYLQTARADEALRLYEALRRMEPDRIEHYINEGNCAAMLGQSNKAEGVFVEMTRLFPGEAAGYRELGRFYLKSGVKYAEALTLIRKAVDIDPSEGNFYLLSWASDMNNDKKGALDAIERALELDPNNSNYRKIQQRLSQEEK